MKLNKLLLIGAIALGLSLTACDKNKEKPAPDSESAYMTVSLSLKSSLKAGGDENANEAEVKVNNIDVFVINGSKFKTASFPVANYTNSGSGVFTPKLEAVMEVPSGSNDVYVAVNLSADQRAKLNNAGVNAFTDAFEETVANVTSSANGFVMVSTEKVSGTGVATKDAAIATPVEVTVERVVGKVAVEVTNAVADGSAVNGGTITDLKFTIRNQNTKLYYMKKNANYEDPNFSSDASTFTEYTKNQTADKTVSSAPVADKGSLTDSHIAYALENTNPTDYKNGNTTYALIEGKYIPTETADGVDGSTLSGGTFYVGDVDHKVYSTSVAATTAGNTTATEYTGGKVYYHVWIGQEDVTKADAPFKRNHFYNIQITKINGVGAAKDPVEDLTPDAPIATSLYLAAKVTVQKWTLVERKVELN